MAILDVNLLLYAVNADAPLHRKAKLWLEKVLSGADTVGLSWNVILAFLRLTTRPGLFSRPLSVEASLGVVAAWLDHDSVVLIHPGSQHFRILSELLKGVGTGGNLTSDAHLAALAIEQGAVLYSLDRDFARFQQLTWKNPLG